MLLQRERAQIDPLMNILNGVKIQHGIQDTWRWVHSKDGIYNTSEAYSLLAADGEPSDPSIYSRIWNGNILQDMEW
ncbi:hypothetical protein SLE2022_258190 [Rubroshorea leprosula]